MCENWARTLGWEDPLEKGMVTYSSILTWRIPMDRGAWRAIVHGVAKSQPQLSTSTNKIERQIGRQIDIQTGTNGIFLRIKLTNICKELRTVLGTFQVLFSVRYCCDPGVSLWLSAKRTLGLETELLPAETLSPYRRSPTAARPLSSIPLALPLTLLRFPIICHSFIPYKEEPFRNLSRKTEVQSKALLTQGMKQLLKEHD